MLRSLFSKVKTWLLVLAVSLGPILYHFGSRQGRKSEELEQAKQAIRDEKDIADFYRDMEGHYAEMDRPRSRGEFTDRLRTTGL